MLPRPLPIRFRKDGFEIARCPSCGLLFRTTLPTAAALGVIYGGSYFAAAQGDTGGQGYADYVGEAELHREAARGRLARLEREVSTGRLLDVGAAAGFFVAEARSRGWDASGIDISGEMSAWGREHLGVDVAHTTLGRLDAGNGRYDAVTMWDYIEHAVEPDHDLVRAHALLRPGGVIALATGDAASLVARLSGRRWHLLTPRHHNYYFTVPALQRLLSRTGFEVVETGHPGLRYSTGYLAYKTRTMLDVSVVRAAADAIADSRLGKLKVPLNLGDVVTVVARRSEPLEVRPA